MAAMAKHEPEKPEYLGLLNAISNGETQAGVYLRAWANATDDCELAETLRFVAARETNHGETFCRRIAELGFELKPNKPDPKAEEYLIKLANPKVSDCEKVGPERAEGGPDIFADIEKAIAAGKYDAMTENMLRWYIAEERDSGKRLKKVYDRVRAEMKASMEMAAKPNGHANGNGKMASEMASGPSADAQAIMACMTEGFGKLEKTLAKLANALK
jgi:rubrerythrin